MARPKQDGLLYFSFDTDFFYADKRIKRLHSRYGSDGIIFYIYLLTEIYRNGYYIRWDAESVDDAMDDLHLTEGLIEQIMSFLISRSLLTKRTLANSDTVITSPGIQKRYQEAVKSRRRDVYVDAQIWLLQEETATHIKVIQKNTIFSGNEGKSRGNKGESCENKDKSCGNEGECCENENKSRVNEGKSCGNESKSGENDRKKSNEKKSKVKQNTENAYRLEDFISAYPKCCNHYLTEYEYVTLLQTSRVTEEELYYCALNYAEYCEAEQTPERYIKNAENFLKEFVFEKYMPGKYKRSAPKKPMSRFHDFPQREYDYKQLEKGLLRN